MLNSDVSVIGAGPVGSYTSFNLAKAGFKVNLFDQKSIIGKPIQCTGLVSKNILDFVKPDKETIQTEIDGARIYSSDNSLFEVKKSKVAFVLDRDKFDNQLFQQAISQGVKPFLNHKLELIANNALKFNKTSATSRYIVGADGPLSQTAKLSNLFKGRKFLHGLQTITNLKDKDENFVELYFGKGFPDFFGWIVPQGNKLYKIGIATKSNPKIHFNNFLKRLKVKQKGLQAGLIPIYNSKVKTQLNNIYLVGDAACQVKPTTGGGLITGFNCSNALTNSIKYGLNYDKEWRRKVGKELLIHSLIRKTLNHFDDKDYNSFIKDLNKSKSEIQNFGDMDYPSKFILKVLLKNPSLLKYSTKLFF